MDCGLKIWFSMENFLFLQRWRTVVLRRYSDFLALQDVLLLRYPYRAIPRLPPKKYIVTEGRGTIDC